MTPTPEQRSAIYERDILESAGLIVREPGRRLSGEQSFIARADHAAGSRSSDGSGTPIRKQDAG